MIGELGHQDVAGIGLPALLLKQFHHAIVALERGAQFRKLVAGD